MRKQGVGFYVGIGVELEPLEMEVSNVLAVSLSDWMYSSNIKS